MPSSLIKSSTDLITSPKAILEGFLNQAIEKTKVATPYVDKAKSFWKILEKVSSKEELINHQEIKKELLAASGFSNKAQKYLSDQQLKKAIEEVLEIVSNEKTNWKEDLFYRYLLTCGDSLGGRMRNIIGKSAETKFNQEILNALKKINITPKIIYNKSNLNKIDSVSWKNRLLVFNKTPKFIDKNIDLILLDTFSSIKSEKNLSFKDFKGLINNPNCYIACGELKGGIDPAGSDEHWKTANTALQRIRESFNLNNCPKLFFVGAAIGNSIAEEIFKQITNETLDYAANLTNLNQVIDLANWLVEL